MKSEVEIKPWDATHCHHLCPGMRYRRMGTVPCCGYFLNDDGSRDLLLDTDFESITFGLSLRFQACIDAEKKAREKGQ